MIDVHTVTVLARHITEGTAGGGLFETESAPLVLALREVFPWDPCAVIWDNCACNGWFISVGYRAVSLNEIENWRLFHLLRDLHWRPRVMMDGIVRDWGDWAKFRTAWLTELWAGFAFDLPTLTDSRWDRQYPGCQEYRGYGDGYGPCSRETYRRTGSAEDNGS